MTFDLHSLFEFRFKLSLGALLLALGSAPAWSKPTAFFVMSGKNPSKHLCEMFTSFEKGIQSFASWDRVVLADNGPNATDPNMPVCDAVGHAQYDSKGQPLYEHRMPKGPPPVAGAARYEVLVEQMRKQVKGTKPGDPILIYIAAHGSRGGGSSHAEFWGHSVSPSLMRALLAEIPSDRKVILVHDQCWGGGMLEEIWTSAGGLRPNTCAFATARADEQGWTREFFMDAVNALITKKRSKDSEAPDSAVTFADAYQHSMDVSNVHSTPVSSSGYYLDQYLKKRLGVKRLGDKPLSSICSECTGHSSGVPMPRNPTLASQILLLKQDMSENAKKAGISPPFTAARLEAQSEEIGAQFDAVFKEQVRLESLLAKAKTEFAKTKVGANLYRSYSEQKKQIEKLEAELLKKADVGKQQKLQELKKAFSAIEREISDHRSAAVKKNPEFQKFLASHKKTYPAGIYELIDQKDSQKNLIQERTPPIRKALLAATQLTALEAMLKTDDQRALNEYLSLLSCESTTIEAKTPLYKRLFR